MSNPLFERHQALLDQALRAIAERGYWSAFPESPSPKVYGEGAAEAGKAAFEALQNKPFPLTLPGAEGTVGAERSPYGFPLGITYPKVGLDALFAAIAKAEPAWRKAGPEAWVGVSLEILARINKRSFEIAHAVMHTTGEERGWRAGGSVQPRVPCAQRACAGTRREYLRPPSSPHARSWAGAWS